MHHFWIVLALGAGAVMPLLDLDDAALGSGLPAGWTVRPVRGQPPPDYTIVESSAGERALRVSGRGAAAWATRELAEPIAPAGGELRWAWRVLEFPQSADLRERKADDSAIRVYVVFGKGGGLFGGGRVIFYTWGNAEPDGLALRSFVSDRIHILRVAGEMEADSLWREQTVRPFDDYRRFWDDDPPAVTAVGLMQDTDQTKAMAVAEFRGLVWDPPGGAAP